MANETFNELAALCRQRSATYGLLARLYRVEVDQAFLDVLHGMRFPASTGNALCDEGYRMIATYLSNLNERSVTELAVDYARVFIGYGVDSYSAAFPFESVYTSEKRLKMQEARDEVLAIYHAYGLDKNESWKENEDHVAVELEFMQVMCNRTVDALETGNEERAVRLLAAQQGFLDEHLAAWVPMFTNDVRRMSKTWFYQGISYLTDGYFEEDAAFLAEVLEESDGEMRVEV